jgi:hypothetical protein
MCQVGIRKASASESLMKCRKIFGWHQNVCNVCRERVIGRQAPDQGRNSAGDGGLLALRDRPMGDGLKPPHAALAEDRLVNTNVGGDLVVDGGSADRGAVRVMEVGWPSGIALQEEVSNQRALRPLTAVRGERHVKRRAMSASGVVREDGRKYLPQTRRNQLS